MTRDLIVNNPDRISYHLAEYNALKSEISELIRQSGSYITFSIAASAGIIAFLLKDGKKFASTVCLAKWLPLSISVIFGLLALTCFLRTVQKSKYLNKIDEQFHANGLGWSSRPNADPYIIAGMQTLTWAIINFGNLYVALYVF